MRDWQPANVSVFTPGAGMAVVGDCQFSQSPYSSGNLHCMNEQDGSPSLDHSSLLQGPAVQPRQQPHPTWWCLSCSLLVVSSTSERTTWKPSTWALSLGILILVSRAKKGEKLGIAYRHHPRASSWGRESRPDRPQGHCMAHKFLLLMVLLKFFASHGQNQNYLEAALKHLWVFLFVTQ